MKGMFKRALAGVAAAALAVTGLALGAGAANAATDENGVVTNPVSFTFTADTTEQLTDRDLDAYKIGDFVQFGTDDNVVYGVQTTAGVDRNALKTALEAAGFTGAPGDGTPDLLAWALSQTGMQFDQTLGHPWGVGTNDSASRKFADSLAASLKDAPATKENILSGFTPTGSDDAGYSVSVNLPAGLYLFIDRTDGTVNVTKAVAMLASTGLTSEGKLTTVTNPVSINFKNEANTSWKKTPSATSVTVGQRLTYTLEGTVPATGAEGFAFYDVPGTGLSIDPDSIKMYEGEIAEANLMQQDDYRVAWGTAETPWSPVEGLYVGSGSNMFTVSINQPVTGTTYFVTYEAVVNSAAANQDKVVNHLTDENGNDIIPPVESKLYGFEFTKQDAQGNKLDGVTFTIYDDKRAELPGYTGGSNGDPTSTSDKDGKVVFKGLAAGKTYTVKETGVKEGFMNMNLSFTVTIDANGVATFSADAWGLVDNDTKTVTNVRNVTQLPLTGAAGTMLFTVLGLLIAGASALVYMKSRNVKHALRG